LAVDPVNQTWSQVANLNTLGAGSLAEENIFRTGHWITRGINGEMRGNVVLELDLHHHLQSGKGLVHHNIFAGGLPYPSRYADPTTASRCTSFIDQFASTDGLRVYNNTFDGRDVLYGSCSGVNVGAGSLIPSVRNNVFYYLKLDPRWSVIDQGWGSAEFPRVKPWPVRLGYADYNDFYCDPAVKTVNNYAVSVAGKTLRKDAGYALHDLAPGGPVNQQVDPRFRGPLPVNFPFSDADIKSGKVTVSAILDYYRSVYAPAEGSPLIDAGDPADGKGTDIGAVERDTAPPPHIRNLAPAADAGPDLTIAWPSNSVFLAGYAGDDGLGNPNGTLTLAWTKVSGPGTVTFSQPAKGFSTATFSQAGTYTLRLTASDGALASSDDAVITIQPAAE
jgi:hypothetical protein